jgi:hypothetical protein
MKKIILATAAVLALTAGNVYANYKWFAGGSFNIGTSKHSTSVQNIPADEKVSYFGINPSLRYIIDDNSDVSIGIGFGSGSASIEADGYAYKETETSFSISAGYERVILTAGSFYFYLWGGVEYSLTKVKITKTGDADKEETDDNFNINITPNVQYSLTDNVALFVNLNFLSLNFDTGGGYNDFYLGADTNNVISFDDPNHSPITIGFSVLF